MRGLARESSVQRRVIVEGEANVIVEHAEKGGGEVAAAALKRVSLPDSVAKPALDRGEVPFVKGPRHVAGFAVDRREPEREIKPIECPLAGGKGEGRLRDRGQRGVEIARTARRRP